MIRRFVIFSFVFSVLAVSLPTPGHADWGSWSLWGGKKKEAGAAFQNVRPLAVAPKPVFKTLNATPRTREQFLKSFAAMQAPAHAAFQKLEQEQEARMAKVQERLAEYNRTQKWETEQAEKKNAVTDAAFTEEVAPAPPKKVIYNRSSESKPNNVYKKY